MKKRLILLAALPLVLLLAGCMAGANAKDAGKYSMNASVAYGAAEDGSLDKTTVTYQIFVGGAKEDVENIASQEILINADYVDILRESGPHQARMNYGDQPYLEMSGAFVFDTQGKSKEEIDAMGLLRGVSVVDKDQNAYVLEFQK